MTNELSWVALLSHILEGKNLSITQASWAMNEVVNGRATDAQLAGFLVGLSAKGETVDEIVGFRDAVLHNAVQLPITDDAVDIVGTGGDRHHTVNISTAASIVVAAAGVPVIKHGNKAASSSSGSSDVLAALGINLQLEAQSIAKVFDEIGITFAFAPVFHPGFRHAADVRAQLGVPTVFNILGPLCNPARPRASAVGVARAERIPLMVGVFQTRDATALVFRGDDGLDELSTTGHSHIWEVSRGKVLEHDFDPADLGIRRSTLDELRGGDPSHNADILRRTLQGEEGPVRDIVELNAASGMVAYALAQSPEQANRPIVERFAEQLEVARATIDSGEATRKIEQWAAVTQR